HRQRARKNNRQRDFPFRSLSCDQCYGHVAIPLDRPNPPLAAFVVCKEFMSEITWRRDWTNGKRKISRREYFWGLTEEIARLGFAPVFPAKLQRIRVCLL